jgi:hypothetical protein
VAFFAETSCGPLPTAAVGARCEYSFFFDENDAVAAVCANGYRGRNINRGHNV